MAIPNLDGPSVTWPKGSKCNCDLPDSCKTKALAEGLGNAQVGILRDERGRGGRWVCEIDVSLIHDHNALKPFVV